LGKLLFFAQGAKTVSYNHACIVTYAYDRCKWNLVALYSKKV